MNIAGKTVGNGNPCFIIAEAGVNHNGRLDYALQLVDVAVAAKADAVKFQTFKADDLAISSAKKADYQINTTGNIETQFEMLRRLELKPAFHVKIIEYCKEKGITFLSTPFDENCVDFLVNLGLDCLKIPSGEIDNLPFLQHVGKLNKTLVLSTGMSTIEDIERALNVLTTSGTSLKNIALLHCTTQYPTPFNNINLRSILTLEKHFPDSVIGFSDHSEDIICPVAAVTLGASIVEKHFTLDCSMEGPDHKASLSPESLVKMVSSIRKIESALGDGNKKPALCELPNIPIVRKYIVASCPIKKGEPFTLNNLGFKRTGKGGVSPSRINDLLKVCAKRDYNRDEPVDTP